MIHPHFDTEPTAPLTETDAYRSRLQASFESHAAQDKAKATAPTVRPGLRPGFLRAACTLAVFAAIVYASLFYGFACGNWWPAAGAIVFIGSFGWATS